MTPTLGRATRGLLLRAEFDGAAVSAILVRGDRTAVLRSGAPAAIGERVRLRLSFPRILAAVELDAEITGQREAGAPGERAEWQLALVPSPATDRVSALVLAVTEPPARARGRCRILLVEANALLGDVFRARLARHLGERTDEVVVDLAPDLGVAWALLTAGSYDLVVFDDALPGASAAQVVTRLRQSPAGAAAPLVAVSVGGEPARLATIAAGADLFLDKPLALAELFPTIDLLLAKGSSMTPKRILIMDDSVLFLELTREALTKAGYEVAIARDLDELERGPATMDLVLMDVQMPEAFGDDLGMVLRHVRGLQAQIFLLSSLDPEDLERRVADAGLDGFISKHIGIEGVVARVGEITSAPLAQAAP